MNRRDTVLGLVSLSVMSMPFSAFAQQQNKVRRIGVLTSSSRSTLQNPRSNFNTFVQTLRELGYEEGKNLVIEWRFAEGKYEPLPALAAELVQLKVDVIVAGSSQAIRAAQMATTTIPIVMGSTGDPVGSGFVKSLAHPGGNITGLTTISTDVSGKLIELLRSLAPKLSRVGVLVDPSSTSYRTKLANVQNAAQSLGMSVFSAEARSEREIGNAFATMSSEKVEAVVVTVGALYVQQARQIAELTGRYRLSSIAGFREYVEGGGLMSYGASLADLYRRAATYVDKIFKGARPADLPVEQPTKFELVINLKSAKALAITVPQSLLIRADRVIE